MGFHYILNSPRTSSQLNTSSHEKRASESLAIQLTKNACFMKFHISYWQCPYYCRIQRTKMISKCLPLATTDEAFKNKSVIKIDYMYVTIGWDLKYQHKQSDISFSFFCKLHCHKH